MEPTQARTQRRKFITLMAQSVGLSALGGMVWTGYVVEAKATPLLLRPPGAKEEDDFLKLCIRCGQCAEACPYDTLLLATPGDQKPLGTPYFIPRSIPCYMCVDIPCVPVCPTGALDAKPISRIENGVRVLDIEKARMGLAVVDMESCIAHWGIQCDACYRACPVMDSAISLEYRRNERTGKHAYLIPVVSSAACTGCGMCERACVTEKPAIFVRPHTLVQGDVGRHYIKGWDTTDERRVEGIEGLETTTTNRSKRSPQEYLNEGGLLDD
ncbi:MAG: ferredoxin-type protein NapG [Campylobacterales bacterium]|nr:ferredoxin-type protein NapG [Campylobacterales bacterium]